MTCHNSSGFVVGICSIRDGRFSREAVARYGNKVTERFMYLQALVQNGG